MEIDFKDEVANRTADLIALQDVKRWGVIALTRQQSVAEHCFNVMVITSELVGRLGLLGSSGDDSAYMWWAMVHDGPECISADIDGRFKRANPDLKKEIVRAENRLLPWYAREARGVSQHVNAVVKLADQMETAWYINRFGIGPRAYRVYAEQLRLIRELRVPSVASEFDDKVDGVRRVNEVVNSMLFRLQTESNNIQMRMDAAGI